MRNCSARLRATTLSESTPRSHSALRIIFDLETVLAVLGTATLPMQ